MSVGKFLFAVGVASTEIKTYLIKMRTRGTDNSRGKRLERDSNATFASLRKLILHARSASSVFASSTANQIDGFKAARPETIRRNAVHGDERRDGVRSGMLDASSHRSWMSICVLTD